MDEIEKKENKDDLPWEKRLLNWGKKKWFQYVLNSIGSDLEKGDPTMEHFWTFISSKNGDTYKMSDNMWINTRGLCKKYGWEPLGAIPIRNDIVGFDPKAFSLNELTYTKSNYIVTDLDAVALSAGLVKAMGDILLRKDNKDDLNLSELRCSLILDYLNKFSDFTLRGGFLMLKHSTTEKRENT